MLDAVLEMRKNHETGQKPNHTRTSIPYKSCLVRIVLAISRWLVAVGMRSVVLLHCVLALASIPTALGACKGRTTINVGREVCEKKIIYEDHFNSKDIYGKWRYVGRFSDYPDYEFVMYDRVKNNLFLKDGMLNIRPTLLADSKSEEFIRKGEVDLNSYPPSVSRCTLRPDSGLCFKKASGFQILPPVLSARVTSRFRFRYGTVEIIAKVPQGDWIYPQIELAPPVGASRYGKSSGVIVIAMIRGNEELKIPGYDDRLNFGSSWLEAGIYAGTYSPKKTPNMVAAFNASGWHDHFHTYRLEWVPGKLTFTVDGEPIGKGSVSTADLIPDIKSSSGPADEELEVALGVGVGGIQRFPDGVQSSGRPKPWKNLSPKAMLNFWKSKDHWYKTWKDPTLQVKSVKVWSM